MIDLTTACQRTADVLVQVTDDQLTAPTPCQDLRLDALLAHIGGLALAFNAAARKEFGPLTDTPPSFDAPLDEDWRVRYPARLTELALAFSRPAAWQGMTRAGTVDFPAEVAGMVALTEVVIHGWDVARAAGLPYQVDADTAAVVLPHVTQIAAEGPVEGLFARAVPVADDAPALDRLVAMTGRDPGWSPGR
ncbi:TIGR03086 family protein [Mycolicibacterium flavescens]|uniref:TIGR03086 family protein n=1 Tax=Mycolicibacterium flavescens TaxID=1776 RepID=A0A1E3RFI0_MYCFV|nr:TIGR03086 family metal-binding protein [Mycolicibacterium flavescens]MCV7278711.1 TIGR03086 family protein [Mycolicibacterium flavescens]ODQ88599.1 TIGR03086 family protein [Mycolicibacterium flavescens]